MPDSMVERLAKAIYERRNGAGCKPWSRLPSAHQKPYLGDAAAAHHLMDETAAAGYRRGLESAACIAEDIPVSMLTSYATRTAIAEAIRALKSKEIL